MTDTEPKAVSVTLDGALTIRDIATVRNTLLAALAEHQAVQVDCRAAEAVDLSFIQLLLSARLSAAKAGKQLTLVSPAEGVLRAALEQGGLLGPGSAECFWSGNA